MPLTSWRPTERRRVPCARCVCAPKWPRSTRTFDYSVPARWAEDVRVGTRVRVPLHGRSVRGWVVGTPEGTLDGIEVLPLKSWLGWGPPEDLVEVAAWASWRWAGPVSFFLHAASPSVVVRASARSPGAGGARPSTGTPATRHRPGSGTGRSTRSGRHDGAAPAGHRPDRSRAVGGPGSRCARPRGQRRRAGPLDGLGGAPHRPARPPRVPGDGCLGRGAGRLARRRGEPCRRLGARAEARRGDRPRRARCGLPGGECADLQRGGRPPRAGTPTGRAVHPRLAGAARGARHRGRGAGAGPVDRCRSAPAGRRWSGWTAVGRTPAPECSRRNSSAWPEPSSTTPPPWHGGRWCASTTGPAAPACWRAATVASWPGARAAEQPRPDPATRRCCGARAAATRDRSSARPVAGCA